MKTIGAAKFKAECLALMDEVNAKGTHIVITKKGKPIAKLIPLAEEKREENPLSFLYIGGGKIIDDITQPVVAAEEYEAAH